MGLLTKSLLCFLLIHLSLSSGSGYEQGNENNVVEGEGMMVRINRRLSRGGGSRSGSRSSSSSPSSNGRSGSGATSNLTPSTTTTGNKNNNGGGTAATTVPLYTGGVIAAGAASRNNNNNRNRTMSASPIGYNCNKIGLLAPFIVGLFLAV
ncbi:hypothetical protein MKX03_019668 [Papaver bracteatum]|nr:hypothetical protein MKX03_019668 [Papaver bracteatum]